MQQQQHYLHELIRVGSALILLGMVLKVSGRFCNCTRVRSRINQSGVAERHYPSLLLLCFFLQGIYLFILQAFFIRRIRTIAFSLSFLQI
ncbi:hypothetical protein F5Y00DRAFT_79073 [Daldinia vernicosa]|uniref:uncharacterized protein n=1 Tax=Daldinia vernicosa TaxID=114800 RepID=UPI002007B00E|nr:uncharacterized protein F5Y00DRAFT_79073 [Daldinia vernicosa]KAI0848977.1 hypothetical protein F5Y00DRAFT_79073 [Daldinia vernicosa]